MKTVLVTGGCGYIGSHTVLSLLGRGYEVVVLDNLSNSSAIALERVSQITGEIATLVVGDIRDLACLDSLFKEYEIDSVMHFAGLKAVGESVKKPGEYHENNVGGSLVLFEAMQRSGLRHLVFSSSATVYGDPEALPVTEDMPANRATNPYGKTKSDIEQILADRRSQDPSWRVAVLRYFNPVGAHESGLIGEDPRGTPNNLSPCITQVAAGKLDALPVFGADYETPDGTGVRDYIHVMDLADGHLAALNYLWEKESSGVWNLGTGRGISVFEMVSAFERASNRSIPTKLMARRDGDIAACWADTTKAAEELGWRASKGIDEMAADAWRWQSRNPDGYVASSDD